jgi:hypothetical protein
MSNPNQLGEPKYIVQDDNLSVAYVQLGHRASFQIESAQPVEIVFVQTIDKKRLVTTMVMGSSFTEGETHRDDVVPGTPYQSQDIPDRQPSRNRSTGEHYHPTTGVWLQDYDSDRSDVTYDSQSGCPVQL